MRKNDWQIRFGAKRRAIDRSILLEAERQIAAEARQATETPPKAPKASTPVSDTPQQETPAQRLAKAFGRPCL